jgi:hypothetical protein
MTQKGNMLRRLRCTLPDSRSRSFGTRPLHCILLPQHADDCNVPRGVLYDYDGRGRTITKSCPDEDRNGKTCQARVRYDNDSANCIPYRIYQCAGLLELETSML